MAQKDVVLIGLLGPNLDSGEGPERWDRWRPTVAICQQEDLIIRRYELLYQKRYEKLAQLIIADIRAVSPETEVRPTLIEFDDPWDLEEVYGALLDFARGQKFDTAREEEDLPQSASASASFSRASFTRSGGIPSAIESSTACLKSPVARAWLKRLTCFRRANHCVIPMCFSEG